MKPIQLLVSEIEEKEEEIQSFLSIDISNCSNNLDELHQTVKKLKSCYEVYADLSRKAVARLTPGSITKALEFRRRRITLHSEIAEVIKLANSMRIDSNLEKESELANLSITSQGPRNEFSQMAKIPEEGATSNIIFPSSCEFEDRLYTLPSSDPNSKVEQFLYVQKSLLDDNPGNQFKVAAAAAQIISSEPVLPVSNSFPVPQLPIGTVHQASVDPSITISSVRKKVFIGKYS